MKMSIRIIYVYLVSYIYICLHFQFNDISLTCDSPVIGLNGSVESDITFPRESDAVNQRNVTARNFYRFARSSRDSITARAPLTA